MSRVSEMSEVVAGWESSGLSQREYAARCKWGAVTLPIRSEKVGSHLVDEILGTQMTGSADSGAGPSRDARDIEILKLMIQKQQEQSDFYYRRFGVFVGFNTAFVGIVALFYVRSSQALTDARLWWSLCALACFPTVASFAWISVMEHSRRWIDFWRAKVQLLEMYIYSPSEWAEALGGYEGGEARYFFLDRLVDTSAALKALDAVRAQAVVEHEIDSKRDSEGRRFGECADALRWVWGRDSDPGIANAGLGARLQLCVRCTVGAWFLLAVLCGILAWRTG